MKIKEMLERSSIDSQALIDFLTVLITVSLVALAAFIVYMLARKGLSKVVMKIAGMTATNWDDLMFDQRFFNRLGVLLAAIVIRIGLTSINWKYIYILEQFVAVWIVFSTVFLISAVLYGANRIYESYPVSRNKPIKVFIQVVMIFLWCAALIVTVQIFTGKDMTAMLAGLTAFAAVLMLVFKDSILGLVAGIQLSANNMVHIGDWITMPSSDADGDVLEINLTTVKVQNWDKTITTIPTYKLVSESFTNWRGMFETDGRRIKRSVNIDVNSIRYLTAEDIEKLKSSRLLKDYIEGKLKELEEFNAATSNILDERRLTNIGTFREYLESWINHNPDINLDMTHLVRQLQPGPTGVPIEVYCFSARQKWVEYERVQSDVFDHVFAVMPLFGLRTFQYSAETPYREGMRG